MTTAFHNYASQGNVFIGQLADELDLSDNKTHALRIFRLVFHGIRSRITPAESLHLIYHLPSAVKAVYVDGWNIDFPQNRQFDYEEFVDEIFKSPDNTPHKLFVKKSDVEVALNALFRALKRNLSGGEFTDLMAHLPVTLRLHLVEYMMEGQTVFL